jgi:predicted ATPase
VDVAGGYVITHTFDQMSKDRPLLAVIAVFNQLCLLIQEKNYQRSQAIVKELLQAFDSEISLLGRLLPNFFAMCPELKASQDDERNDHVTLRSMCFTLRRFLRVVSSKTHPVVLFLDDLQWCDNSSLTVVESILCDSIKSNSFFFVGSYRSNEVAEDHGIFHLINNLRTFGVPTTTVVLEGLNPADLNTMISDALCIFPRMCESLSNIVHTKTKGNPLFVLEFLRSLVDGKLLNYSLRKRRWVWDEVLVNGVEIADNVLFLLTSKMSRLPNNIQSALKVGACFGLKIEEPVVSILSATPDYSNILRDLEQVVEEGFMVKIGPSEFKFVHDKVQEAAYSLVPYIEKNKVRMAVAGVTY